MEGSRIWLHRYWDVGFVSAERAPSLETLWRRLMGVSLDHIGRVYERLLDPAAAPAAPAPAVA